MDKFTKAILNYFATYTETRFRFQTKIDYRWTDDEFTAELSVFPDFQKMLLNSIQSGQSFSMSIKKGDYSISIDDDLFKKELIKKLDSEYTLEFLQNCVDQARESLKDTEKFRVIIATEGKEKELETYIQAIKEFDEKARYEGIRQFNLAFRRCIREVLLSLQKKKKEELINRLNIVGVPATSLNPNTIEQNLFDLMQKKAHGYSDEKVFYDAIKGEIEKGSWNLLMYDLYSTIRKFNVYIRLGTPYIFFQELQSPESDQEQKVKYPIFLMEIDISPQGNEVILKSSRDILLINTPAINSFSFKNILTTPRAARIVEAKEYLSEVETFLQNCYSFFEPFLLEYGFRPLSAPQKPSVNFRIGLQIVQKENRKLLDYSELITWIDAGRGKKLKNFILNYVSGNVENTTDEVDSSYSKKYPRKSASNLLSTLPISLNKPQKRIITALENPKNQIIVVDGPPGTGKSYTIAAITYWANQRNKSVVITSHKKAALDVIDQMLTDKFKELHPAAKPSVLRLSREATGINTFQNTLSGPVIAAGSSRVNEFNESAVQKDTEDWRGKVESQIDQYWENSGNYRPFIEKLFRLEQIENGLKQSGVLKDGFSIPKIGREELLDIQLIKECVELVKNLQIKGLSVEQLSHLFNERDSIQNLLNLCNQVNKSPYQAVDIGKIQKCDTEILNGFSELLKEASLYLKENSPVFSDFQHLKFKFGKMLTKKKGKLEVINSTLTNLNNLQFEALISNISQLNNKPKEKLTVYDLIGGVGEIKEVEEYINNLGTINYARKELGLEDKDIKHLFNFLNNTNKILSRINQETITSLNTLAKYFSEFLKSAGIDMADLNNLSSLFSEGGPQKDILEYIQLFSELSREESYDAPSRSLIDEYYESIQKNLEYINDKRVKNLNNHMGDIQRILVTLEAGKRLTLDELNVLLKNISCIISEPDRISRYFPMEEDVIDVLVIDEASQVSIAESISLILRAKQIVVFGDELQYGAVSAMNVNSQYAGEFFREILEGYESDYEDAFAADEKEKLTQEVSAEIDEEEQTIEPIYKPEEGTKEWLKTFSIRTSTLNFAKALKNYSTSLDTHFRSFPEIIDYSNEFFYKPSQTTLIVNRIRTKPIKETLRFIKVETQGNAGQNVNLDEIDAIRKDIQGVLASGFKGTIGIITSFREQKDRMFEVLRRELPNFHYLEKDHKFTVWFVGDVQGEERDIVYYSFVEDRKIGNGSLRHIYPIIGGSADNIRKLKMQRLNVGFSRAKDTMVFVHSMPIEEYTDTRLGDALKHYKQLLEQTTDNYIKDTSIFGSPAEEELYNLIINTEFYKKYRDIIKLIAQFPIGEYIQQTMHKYIPRYRVDFLMTLSERGKERSLVLEYDGVQYHTINPEIVTEHNFSQEYLDYDVERQLELESYGYKFLRINKFTLMPKEEGQTKVDVLNSLLETKFAN